MSHVNLNGNNANLLHINYWKTRKNNKEITMGLSNVFSKSGSSQSSHADQIKAINRSQAVIEFNMDGTIITANENFLDTMGYTLDEVVGKHHSMFVEPEDANSQDYADFWLTLNRGDFQAREFKRLAKDGRVVWIQASYNPIFDRSGKPYMVIKYASDITKQKVQEIENYRIKEALDKVSANLMVADADFNIIYFNKMAGKLFHDAESEIRKDLPHFNAQNLLGCNIDTFHKNPSHQRQMLTALNSTFESSLKLGSRTFRIVANPIVTSEGKRLGTVVEWADRTLELSIEDEVQSLVDSALQGDLSNRISLDGKKGFLMRLSKSINNLIDVADLVIKDTVRVLGAMSQGDLTARIEAKYHGAFEQLKNDANKTNEQLASIITRIKENTNLVNAAASEISSGNMDLSRRTESQAASLEETSASMEEMTSSVKQNADNASQANELAMSTQDHAQQGTSIVEEAIAAMHKIDESSSKITNIITVIDEIAFQTNLLALNASVEAARAGEHGRGFAVVATEVRNLAGRSATAAKEIKDLIVDSSEKVEEGSRLVNQSGETLQTIMDSVKKVTEIVGDIANASQEQASGIEQVNIAISEIDAVTQQNTALVEEASASAETMSEQSSELNQLVEFFEIGETNESSQIEKQPVNTIERRAADRPWSNNTTNFDNSNMHQSIVNGSEESDWSEF